MRIGRYRILNRVASGGMAEIYRAEVGGNRLLAIKKILPQHISNEKFIKMFFDEAKIMITLRHPNIVQIYDFGKVENDYFLALEWVEGKALSSLIHQQKKQRLSFPPGVATYIILEMLCGLEYAHTRKDAYNRELGVVHRDISPPNVLISIAGEVKVADFGIAKAGSNVSQTNPGVLKGKYSYMSPEQANGLEIDARSDIFSCGIMLYEMLTSTRLFLGDSDVETLKNVREKEVEGLARQLPHLPSDLIAVVEKALQRKLSKRYQSAHEMANDLEKVWNRHYEADNNEALRGFFQFLYPRAPIYTDNDAKHLVIAQWNQRLSQLPSLPELRPWWHRHWHWLLAVLLSVILLSVVFWFTRRG